MDDRASWGCVRLRRARLRRRSAPRRGPTPIRRRAPHSSVRSGSTPTSSQWRCRAAVQLCDARAARDLGHADVHDERIHGGRHEAADRGVRRGARRRGRIGEDGLADNADCAGGPQLRRARRRGVVGAGVGDGRPSGRRTPPHPVIGSKQTTATAKATCPRHRVIAQRKRIIMSRRLNTAGYANYYPGQEGTTCSSGPRSQIGSNRSPAMTVV